MSGSKRPTEVTMQCGWLGRVGVLVVSALAALQWVGYVNGTDQFCVGAGGGAERTRCPFGVESGRRDPMVDRRVAGCNHGGRR